MSDSDFALRLASPAELREMVQTLTRERDEARAEVEELRTRTAAQLEIETRARDEARAEVERLRALPSAEDLEERAHEILDGAGIPTHALDPVSGEEDYRASLEERLEWTVEEITRLRDRLQTVVDEQVSPHETLPAEELITLLEHSLAEGRHERERLRGALEGLMLSRDASWTGGHDWQEALEAAAAALAGEEGDYE